MDTQNTGTIEAQTPEEEFAAAFAESVAPEAVDTPAQGAGNAGVDTESVEAEAGEVDAASPGGKEPAPEDANAGKEDAVPPPGESAFAQELAKLRQEITKPAESEPDTPENTPENANADAEADAANKLSEEDQRFLAEYEKDWPDISRAEAIKRQQDIYKAVEYIFAQVSKALSPIVERYQQSDQEAHDGEIRAAHEDYDTVRQQVIDWVNTQTGTRGKVFAEIVKGGTAAEIVDLVSIWKEATGKTKPQVSQDAGSPSASAEPPPKAKQAAQKLSVVSSKRTQVPAVADANDFDGAWAEATGKS